MNIGIIGLGGLGGLFAGYLSEEGETVFGYDVQESLVQDVNTNGIRIRRPDDTDIEAAVRASIDPTELGPMDICFIFVKAMHTADAMNDVSPALDNETIVVTLQNGLTNVAEIESHITPERILAGTTYMGGETVEDGELILKGTGGTKLGGEDAKVAKSVAETLTNAGIETDVVDDPLAHIWDKQIPGAGWKPISALTKLPVGPLIENEETNHVLRETIAEARSVAHAKGLPLLTDDVDKKLSEVKELHYSSFPSMVQDVREERPTEIGHINGEIVRSGEELEIPTPYNRMLWYLVSGREAAYDWET